jgi:hypothetical protein
MHANTDLTPLSCVYLFWYSLSQNRIADVERKKYCFSDGVGRISPELLEEVVAAVPWGGPDAPPLSAIQVTGIDALEVQ